MVVCPHCHAEYLTTTGLRTHVQTAHPHHIDITCQFCRSSFATARELVNHQRQDCALAPELPPGIGPRYPSRRAFDGAAQAQFFDSYVAGGRCLYNYVACLINKPPIHFIHSFISSHLLIILESRLMCSSIPSLVFFAHTWHEVPARTLSLLTSLTVLSH